jgi:hypothetical protein
MIGVVFLKKLIFYLKLIFLYFRWFWYINILYISKQNTFLIIIIIILSKTSQYTE